jgi:hypothetical protein
MKADKLVLRLHDSSSRPDLSDGHIAVSGAMQFTGNNALDLLRIVEHVRLSRGHKDEIYCHVAMSPGFRNQHFNWSLVSVTNWVVPYRHCSDQEYEETGVYIFTDSQMRRFYGDKMDNPTNWGHPGFISSEKILFAGAKPKN